MGQTPLHSPLPPRPLTSATVVLMATQACGSQQLTPPQTHTHPAVCQHLASSLPGVQGPEGQGLCPGARAVLHTQPHQASLLCAIYFKCEGAVSCDWGWGEGVEQSCPQDSGALSVLIENPTKTPAAPALVFSFYLCISVLTQFTIFS